MEHLEVCARAQVGAREALSERSDAGQGGGGHAAPAVHSSLARLRARVASSVWAPVALKLASIGLGMLVLGGIGVGSLWLGSPGVKVPLQDLLRGDVRSAWLASKPDPHPAGSAAAPPEPAPSAPITTPVADTTVGSSAEPAPDAAPTPAPASGITSDGKVILNQASVDELTKLPGVGHKRALAIVALRTKLGGHFKRPTDLLRVKGIGVRGLKKMLPHLVLDPPAEAMVHA